MGQCASRPAADGEPASKIAGRSVAKEALCIRSDASAQCLSGKHGKAGLEDGFGEPEPMGKAAGVSAGKAQPAAPVNAPVVEADGVIDITPSVVPPPETSMIQHLLDPESAAAKGLPYQVHFLGPPPPPCEDDRLSTSRALELMDRPADPEIASILKLVASIFRTPAALVALFDYKRVYISDSDGAMPRGDFPWRWTLCAWSMAYKNAQILVVPDTQQDPRFRDNEKVTTGPKVRFYCGAPLIASNGHRLGTVCFLDLAPRAFDAASCSIMNNLAELVVRHLEKDLVVRLKAKDNIVLTEAYDKLQRTMDCLDHCVVLLDTAAQGWPVLYANAAWKKMTGLDREAMVGTQLRELLEGEVVPGVEHEKAASNGKEFVVYGAQFRNADGKPLVLRFRPASKQSLDDDAVPVGIPSFLPYMNPDNVVDASRFYFMAMESPVQSKVTSRASSQLSIRSSACSWASRVEGLELGHLLGKGAFGSVYSGTWFGTHVAVKVVDETISATSSGSLEAVLGARLRHPHIVATLKYAVKKSASSAAHSMGDSAFESNSAHSFGNSRSSSVPYSVGNSRHSAIGTLSITNGTRRGAGSPTGSSNRLGCYTEIVGAEHEPAVVTALMSHRGSNGGTSPLTPRVPVVLPVVGSFNNSRLACTSLGDRPVVFDSGDGLSPSSPSCVIQEEGAVGSFDGEGEHAVAVEEETVDNTGLDSGGSGEGANGWAVINFHGNGEAEDGGDAEGLGVVAPAAQDLLPIGTRYSPHTSGTIILAAGGGSGRGSGSGALVSSSGGSEASQTWMVMEYCDKGSLQDGIDRGWLRHMPGVSGIGLPNVPAIIATAREIASAMRYLHTHGIVHGDLSAWNVMLSSMGSTAGVGGRNFIAKVADFGLARSLDLQSKIQTRNYGTLTHMPPETLKDGIISTATDVYSFGVLLWQIYTGSRPWAGQTHGQIILLVGSGQGVLHYSPGVPESYATLTAACMAQDPADRPTFTDIDSLLQDMQAANLTHSATEAELITPACGTAALCDAAPQHATEVAA